MLHQIARFRIILLIAFIVSIFIVPVVSGAAFYQPPPAFDLDELLAVLDSYVPGAGWIFGTILLNVVLAVAASVRTSEFELQQLVDFLARQVLPLVASYFVVSLIGNRLGFDQMGPALFVAIEAALGARIIKNWDRLGLPMLDRLVKLAGGKS